ncbi:MAG: prolipoprotein diacylglyceryl transferase [Acutalibacteraceae bacterium]|jgi:phosphatidylglycerol:prolipoprotein diacylglycerol transferase|nr:prolipoprotein diacylglyceryl transferase [Clostridiales bacterium]
MSDYSIVYFTGIERGFSVPSVLAEFKIFGVDMQIKWYGALIALGFVLGLLASLRLAKKEGMNVDKLLDCIIYGTIFAIIGARLYFVAFNWDYYSQNLSEIPKTYEGGMAIYGGLIGGIVAAYVVCKINKTSILKTLDVTAVGFLIGQGIGRWGNFTNQEAFGTNTTRPWGMTSQKVSEYIYYHQEQFEANGFSVDPNIPVHPTFLYESVWCIIGAILLYIMCSKYKKFDGQIILSYGVWYGVERMIVEGLRTDSLYIASTSIRVSQVLSGILAIVCLAFLIYNFVKASKKSKDFGEKEKILIKEGDSTNG